MNKVLTGLILLVSSASASAGGLDLALSNDTAYLSVLLNRDPLYSTQNLTNNGGAEISVGAFTNEVGDNILHATLMARGIRQSVASQYQFSAGLKLIGGEVEGADTEDRADSEDSETVGALAIGFQAGLLLQPSFYNPVELTFEGFYSPSIASFSDAERFFEVTARLQVEIMPRARAYIGYRRMEFDTNDFSEISLDRNAHVGISISF